MFKKDFIILALIALGTLFLISDDNLAFSNNEQGPYSLSPLSYSYDALEPYFDARTMEVHHSLHHAAYVNNLNRALSDTSAVNLPLEDLLASISKYPVAVRNNAGGHYNHELFWKIITPGGSKQPSAKLAKKINDSFGSLEQLKEQLNSAALSLFGSGWAWLIIQDGKLKITTTQNQDNPLMDTVAVNGTPLLGIDLWEHAYYLKYQNRRAEYLAAFWKVVNWDYVSKRFDKLEKK